MYVKVKKTHISKNGTLIAGTVSEITEAHYQKLHSSVAEKCPPPWEQKKEYNNDEKEKKRNGKKSKTKRKTKRKTKKKTRTKSKTAGKDDN